MKWTSLNELREKYLAFFESKGHLRMDSFPLVPKDDNSLLLINSGMAPLKKYFMGQAVPPRNRVTTCQKCIRTPDIERVGKTSRHGTFFEMLGNFSFGDYFKGEATAWAWEFLTETLEMPKDRLFISVYEEDDEAYDIWTQQVGIAPDHMVRLGKEDNFWEIGSGPCGPCSEIYFDRGEAKGCGKDTCGVGCDCDRYIEIWNLVFTQFVSDGNGNYERMAKPNIDTGMGLERLACMMQEVDNLFEVDTVQKIMRHVESLAGISYKEDEGKDISIRVICDHIRSTVFMVGDGVIPSNEGRGYVLRRLLRRAARHGRMLGIKGAFLAELCDTVIDQNLASYPYLNENRAYIKNIIAAEEERFSRTIDAGINMLAALMDGIDAFKAGAGRILSGADAFKLNDTFGFPLDLTKEILAEKNIEVDEEGFKQLLSEQRDRARKARAAGEHIGWVDDVFQKLDVKATTFVGYEQLAASANVVAVSGGKGIESEITAAGEPVVAAIVLDCTPFYAESGGQVADVGVIEGENFKFVVDGCKKTGKGLYVHSGVLEYGTVKTGDKAEAAVDKATRLSTARNHTGAHLLQQALRDVLGSHIHQAGSYIDAERLRFDFAHFSAVSAKELAKIEDIVNAKILEAIDTNTKVMSLKEAKDLGATALFGEKYGDTVRVLDIGGYSLELCGGTHLKNTAVCGLFKILSESSVSAGIRRIEATTGAGVLNYIEERNGIIAGAQDAIKLLNAAELPAKVAQMQAQLKDNDRQLTQIKAQLAEVKMGGNFADKATVVKGVKIFALILSGVDGDTLRQMAFKIRDREPDGVAVLFGEQDGKAQLAIACGTIAREKGLKAGALVKAIAAVAGGSGGGKDDFAMAGIRDVTKMDEALIAATDIISGQLA